MQGDPMMYDLQYRRPDLIAFSDKNKNIVLRSSSKTVFMYNKLYSDIYVKSPYIRGNTLWKQLPSNIGWVGNALQIPTCWYWERESLVFKGEDPKQGGLCCSGI